MHPLKEAFEHIVHKKLLSTQRITGSGSNRQYIRLKGKNHSLIGVIGESREENIAFVELSKHFRKKGLPVPEVLYFSPDETSYIQQDLGDVSLFDIIQSEKEKGISSSTKELLMKTIRKLAEFQFKGSEGLDFSICYPVPEFNKRTVLWDLNYFKYYFLKPSGISFSENKLEDDFEKMSHHLLQGSSGTFLYRDFQSRNVMIVNNEPYFIDFQGGRKGPVYYDVASFVWQAKANYSEDLREEIVSVYFSELKKYSEVSREVFREQLKEFILFRTIQVLGAYGYRGFFEKKPHFLESIPFALKNINDLFHAEEFEYSYLKEVVMELYTDYNNKKT